MSSQQLLCYCAGYPDHPHGTDHEDCESGLLVSALNERGHYITLKEAVDYLFDYGTWEEAVQAIGREVNEPHPSLSLWERNQ
jgi:hypothetical protein